MKDQLEALAQEMIKEVRDLKDLTKKELPEIAKEYISYNMTMSVIGMIICGVVLVLSLIGVAVAFFVLEMGSGAFVATLLLSVIFSMVSFIIMCTSLCNYLDFKLQPRRMSIKAITSLLE